MTTYSYGTSTVRYNVLQAPPSMALDWKHGDMQYQRTNGEQVGKSFYYLVGKTRLITGVAKPYIGMHLCLFGRRTKGWKGNERTCSTVKNVGQSKHAVIRGQGVDIDGLVETNDYVSDHGDSGGPWFYGGAAIGINQGSMRCGFAWLSQCGVFTPLAWNEGRGSFNVHVWH